VLVAYCACCLSYMLLVGPSAWLGILPLGQSFGRLYDHRTIAEIVICGGRESNLVRDHLRIANEGNLSRQRWARIPWERNQSMGWVNSARYERQSEPGFERSHLHLLPRRKLRGFNTFARIFDTPWRRACGPGPDFIRRSPHCCCIATGRCFPSPRERGTRSATRCIALPLFAAGVFFCGNGADNRRRLLSSWNQEKQ
jgi:hypothetical protein